MAQAPADPRIAFFDGHAPTWDQSGPNPAVTLHRLDELAHRLGLQPGQDLLEVGCGTGQITAWLADRVKPGRVTAVDFSPGMLAQARARGVDADFELRDICLPAPASKRFDVVLCFHSFPHFRSQAEALKQIATLLKPAGRLLVVHLAGSAQLNAFHHKVGGPVGHDHLPPSGRWTSLLAPAGLQILEAADQDDLFLLVVSPLACLSGGRQ